MLPLPKLQPWPSPRRNPKLPAWRLRPPALPELLRPKQKPNLSSTEMFQTPRRILRRTVPNTPVLPLHPEPDTPDSDDLGHEPWTPPMNYIRDGVVWQTPRSPNNCPDSPGSIHHFTSRVETPFRVRHAEFLRQAGWKPMTETSK